jgi:leucyl aminopeptidase
MKKKRPKTKRDLSVDDALSLLFRQSSYPRSLHCRVRLMLRNLASRSSALTRVVRCFLAAPPRKTTATVFAPIGTMATTPMSAATFRVSSETSGKPQPQRRGVAPARATRGSTRAYAVSGGSFPAGVMHPHADLAVTSSSVVYDAKNASASEMVVFSMCEADCAALGASDAVFDGVAPGLGSLIKELVDEKEFKGKAGTSVFTRVPSSVGMPFKHVGLVGVGDPAKSDITPEVWIAYGKEASKAARESKCASLYLRKYWIGDTPEMFKAKLSSIAIGAYLGTDEDVRFKSKSDKATLTNVIVSSPKECDPDLLKQALQEAYATAAGVTLTKQLVAAPPNVVTPTALASTAIAIADEFPETMTVKILEEAECRALGMGAYLGVSEASDEPPKFIHLTYTPVGSDAGKLKKVAIVGKGLTFDSGGYNIKAGAGSMIEMMKFDMGGSGATLGAARTVAQTAPPNVQAHFIIAACENMIGSRGLRPGDILTASNGKTIEVNNTDAEGRLTLADAIVYAEKTCEASSIVDVATLTGAIIVGLGPEVAGMFSNNDALAAELEKAALTAGESFWRMPIRDSYWKACGMESEYADMKNTGSRGGGAITAALFLQKYVEKSTTRWAHLDIAGPVWDDKKGGATGFGAATLAKWIEGQGK